MSDLIDRQAAIDALIERDPSGLDRALNIIKELPSAQPEQRTPCSEKLKMENDELKAHIEYLSCQAERMKGEIKALAYSVRCNGVSGNEVPYDQLNYDDVLMKYERG